MLDRTVSVQELAVVFGVSVLRHGRMYGQACQTYFLNSFLLQTLRASEQKLEEETQ